MLRCIKARLASVFTLLRHSFIYGRSRSRVCKMKSLDKHEDRKGEIIAEILSLRLRIGRATDGLDARLTSASELFNDSNRYASPDYWRFAVFRGGLIKVRLIIEQNFQFVETFGILAITRYMLELLIWFRLLAQDGAYSFVYAHKLLTDSCNHVKEHLSKVRKEVELFRLLDKQESEQTEKILDDNALSPTSSSNGAFRSTEMIGEVIDHTGRCQFSLYSRDARTRGFGYQAHLMETQIIPELEQELEQLQGIRAKAISQMPESARTHKWWKWNDQAKIVGLSDQFEFLYAYTSRLLHAHPTSITTNQKNLELHEIVMFLDFLYVSMLETIEIAERSVELRHPAAN
jgi:hypothetical protein